MTTGSLRFSKSQFYMIKGDTRFKQSQRLLKNIPYDLKFIKIKKTKKAKTRTEQS